MQKLSEMTILETQIIQRDWDKRWEKVVKIMDYDHSYTYRNEAGVSVTLIPEKWIVVDVFDALMEIVD
jgi:hypothetical protein